MLWLSFDQTVPTVGKGKKNKLECSGAICASDCTVTAGRALDNEDPLIIYCSEADISSGQISKEWP